jgi:hypothetical protein
MPMFFDGHLLDKGTTALQRRSDDLHVPHDSLVELGAVRA